MTMQSVADDGYYFVVELEIHMNSGSELETSLCEGITRNTHGRKATVANTAVIHMQPPNVNQVNRWQHHCANTNDYKKKYAGRTNKRPSSCIALETIVGTFSYYKIEIALQRCNI